MQNSLNKKTLEVNGVSHKCLVLRWNPKDNKSKEITLAPLALAKALFKIPDTERYKVSNQIYAFVDDSLINKDCDTVYASISAILSRPE